MMLSDMGDLSPCVKTRTAEQGTPYALRSPLTLHCKSVAKPVFFLTTDTEVNRSRLLLQYCFLLCVLLRLPSPSRCSLRSC